MDASAPGPFDGLADLGYKVVYRTPRPHTWQYTRACRAELSFFVRFRYRKLKLTFGEPDGRRKAPALFRRLCIGVMAILRTFFVSPRCSVALGISLENAYVRSSSPAE